MAVTPTRMVLNQTKDRLKTAQRGHKLLKDKRDELMRQFMDLVREDMELRLKVEQAIKDAIWNSEIPNEHDAARQLMLKLGAEMGLGKA